MLGALALAGCGGGGGSYSPSTPVATPTPTPTPTATATPSVANTASVTLDAGPAALNVGANAYTAFNTPYVTITLCAPGSTTNCQTIDHVLLDTGSVGLRIIQPVLNASLLAAMPVETDGAGNPVGECYQYVSSYTFGSVRQADFQIAGEKVASMPLQVVDDTGVFATVPSGCSSGGGSPTATVQDLGANAIIGIGSTATDCGTACESAGSGGAAASYYNCPSTGCSGLIARTAATTGAMEQLPNPVAAFATDNNGTIITLPSVAQGGVTTLTGTITFGIGTQSDNTLGAATVLPLTTSASKLGAGLLTATYNTTRLTASFLDTGSGDFYFEDSNITPCKQTGFVGYYCPASPTLISPTLTGTNNASASGAFTLYNPTNVAATANAAPGLGINPTAVNPPLAFSNSFDFGLPFYFGRTVYTAIEGFTAGGTQGPYVAF